MRFYLVQAMLNTRYGLSGTRHRVVAADDPINAAKECFDDLTDGQKRPGVRYPDHFRVWAQLEPVVFQKEVGPLRVEDDFDEDSKPALKQVEDMFEGKYTVVRL